jgi:hypothetical protein
MIENEEDICLRDISVEAELGAEISSLRREESRTKQMIHLTVFPQDVLSVKKWYYQCTKSSSGNLEDLVH